MAIGLVTPRLVPTGDTWLGSPVMNAEGPIQSISELLPSFDRRPFCVTSGLAAFTAENPRADVIVRRAGGEDESEIPVAVVSKTYALLQHRDVLEVALRALADNGVRSTTIDSALSITELGERMELRLKLPNHFDFDPGDGHPLGLQLHFINSVDGSTRLTVLVGWLRFVCRNGLIAGTTSARTRQVHDASLDVEGVAATIRHGLNLAVRDRDMFVDWVSSPISKDVLQRWVDGQLKKTWGVKAATRAYHILSHGRDVRLAKPFEKCPPSQRAVDIKEQVPGATAQLNAYAVSQALAWLARDRRDLQERMTWMLRIPELVYGVTAK